MAAAKGLHLTQPAVSLQIRELEMPTGLSWWIGSAIARFRLRPAATSSNMRTAFIRESVCAEVTLRHHRKGWFERVYIGTSTRPRSRALRHTGSVRQQGGVVCYQGLPMAQNKRKRVKTMDETDTMDFMDTMDTTGKGRL